jgi:anthranilate/para-aminobenzoate synthase component II
MHGKTTWIAHSNHPIFDAVPSPLEAMRYHSLLVSPQGFPGDLDIIAWSADRPQGREIMALCHRTLPIYGVQFHPESIATTAGKRMLSNFLSLARGGASPAPSGAV